MSAATLELHVLSYAGSESATAHSVRLGHSPVSIGRSPACHLALEDPERLISRSHLSAWLDAHGKAWIRNASGTTPVFVEGQELPPGAQTGLHAGQTLVLGRYLLAVRVAQQELQAVHSAADPHGSGPPGFAAPSAFAPIPEEFDVFAAPQATRSASGGSDTRCGLSEFSGEAAALSEVFDGLPDFDARGPGQAPEVLDVVRGGALVGSAPAGPERDPLDRLLSGSAQLLDGSADTHVLGGSVAQRGDEVDGLFRMPVATSPDPVGGVGSIPAPTPATSPSAAAGPLDPLALDLGASMPGEPGPGSSLFDLIGEAGESSSGPTVAGAGMAPSAALAGAHPAGRRAIAPEDLMSQPIAPRQSAPTSSAAPVARADVLAASPRSSDAVPGDAISAAFARGCGLDPGQLGSLDAASVETLGRLFQSLVAGTLQLIHARSSTKDELRAHMTMIATSGNNPLKFAPDAQAAMLQLVGRGLPGFMPPVEAVRDAFGDLSAHQVGLLAASRSAMYAMAGRLSPESIHQRVGGPRGFSGLLPSAHKAQLWDAFVASHAQLLGEAREEFDAAFQGAFVDAYEGEVRRMQSGGAA